MSPPPTEDKIRNEPISVFPPKEKIRSPLRNEATACPDREARRQLWRRRQTECETNPLSLSSEDEVVTRRKRTKQKTRANPPGTIEHHPFMRVLHSKKDWQEVEVTPSAS
jgi:hypothetical protein